MSIAAVLVAAGDGSRLGAARPKALVELCGRSLVAHAADRLVLAGLDEIVVVAHPDHLQATQDEVGSSTRVVAGGQTRSESVRRGLDALGPARDVVAVHDAARALTPATVIRDAVLAVTGDVVAAAPGVPVADTLKRVRGGAVETVSRDDLVAVQTPQVFVRAVLEAAHASGADATDDLALVEDLLGSGRASGRIVFTEGSPLAMKITYEQDLLVAEALLAADADGRA